MYSKEQFDLKIRHVCERKICDARGREITFQHNLMKTLQQKKNKIRTESIPQTNGEESRKSNLDVRHTTKSTTIWTPSTSRKDIDDILKRKSIRLGTRQLPTTKIRLQSDTSPKEVNAPVKTVPMKTLPIPYFDT